MRGERRRTPTRGESTPLERLWLLLVQSGPVLSLAGLVVLVGGMVIRITIRELHTPALILIYLAAIMLLVSLVTHFAAVRATITARTGRYTTNTLIMIGAFLAILVLLGFISYENSIRVDMTATRQFTLAPQTKEVLHGLSEPVEARAYFKVNDSRQELTKRITDDFFHEFSRTSGNFTYEFIDPDLKPGQARQDGVTEYPTIVFTAPESQNSPFSLKPPLYEDEFLLSEQDLVSSLLITTGAKRKTVYFTTGHGERNTSDSDIDSNGFGFALRGLLGDSYRVCTINLKQVETMPQGDADQPCGEAAAAALIIAGPTGGFLQSEKDIVNAYLRSGGNALFLVDNAASSDMNSLLNTWGVGILDGAIVDLERSASGDPRSPIVRRSQYNADSLITGPLDDTFFTEVAAIKDIIVKAPQGLPRNPDEQNITITPLAYTSLFSCVTTDPDKTTCSGSDVPGPHIIAAAVEALAPVGEDPVEFTPDTAITTIVVFGDSDFASNTFYYAFSNSDLFLNAVDWLTQNYDLISIRAKPQAFRHLIITRREFDFIRYSSWFLLPTGLLLLAGIAWWRRR